jgi:hypothetical protein
MRAPLVVVAVALLGTPAYARVGDTIKQIEARYGKPQHVYFERRDAQEFGYYFHRFMIVVHFSHGISKWENFTRWPEAGRLPRFSPESVKEILALTAPAGTSWQPIPPTKNGKYWVSSDKKVLAYFASEGNDFLVRDPNFEAKD